MELFWLRNKAGHYAQSIQIINQLLGRQSLFPRKIVVFLQGPHEDHLVRITEGVDIGLLAKASGSRGDLRSKLQNLFPNGINAMEYCSDKPETIAVLTGSGQSAVDKILDAGSDTLVTGELRQHHFNLAQELRLNLYACGHYATETFGVDALAREVSEKFDLPYEFIETPCPL